eukprot:3170473-Pleurochrysis_carterae.AAC.1
MLSGASKLNANADACRQGDGGREGSERRCGIAMTSSDHRDAAEAQGCNGAQTIPICKFVSSSLLIYHRAMVNHICICITLLYYPPPTRSRAAPPRPFCGLKDHPRQQSSLTSSNQTFLPFPAPTHSAYAPLWENGVGAGDYWGLGAAPPPLTLWALRPSTDHGEGTAADATPPAISVAHSR